MRVAFSLLSLLLSVCIAAPSFALTLAGAASLRQQGQGTAAPLTNKDVAEMVKMGLSTEVIVAKIKISTSNFDTAPAALQELKAAGVPDAVILAMVEAPSGDSANRPAAAAGGPAESGPAAETAGGGSAAGGTKAIVHVYRKKNFNSRNMQPSVYVDGEEVARMDDGKFFIINLTPGKHSVEVNKGHSGAEVEFKAGEHYYFRVDIKPGFLKARSEITYMQKEQGSLEVQKMNPLEDKWIKDKSRVTTEAQTTRTQ